MSSAIYAIATMDTKGAELDYLVNVIKSQGINVTKVDVGTGAPPQTPPDVSRETVAAHHPDGAEAVLSSTDRGTAVSAMAVALELFLSAEHDSGRVVAVVGIGGSGGTSLITRAMRALPIGVGKVMVSTVASGNTLPYVDCTDITMMYSVVDISGINRVSRMILANTAGAVAGMAKLDLQDEADGNPCIGLTMFGVTTPCVDAVRKRLDDRDRQSLVFHATGTGGRAMERLVRQGDINAVVDITTTEVADFIVGGVFPCAVDRFDCLAECDVPSVISVGALDMVNFGGMETVPARFRERLLYQHNSEVTLMRTSIDECRSIGAWIAEKVNKIDSPVVMLLPERGVSALSEQGQLFHDAEADAALFDSIDTLIKQTQSRQVRRLPMTINSPDFAEALVDAWVEVSTAAKR